MSTPAPRFFCVYIAAPNDTNGNPRRGWYVHDLVDPCAEETWIEEGYGNFPWPEFARILGMPEVPGRDYFDERDWCYTYVRMSGRIDVTPGEYRAARKFPRFGGAK